MLKYIFIIAICLFFAIRSIKYYGALVNPHFAFNVLWLVVSTFLIIGNPLIYAPSDTSVFCVLTGIIGYNLSMYSYRIRIRQHSEDTAYYLNEKILSVCALIVLILMLNSAIASIRDILSGVSFSQIRNEYFTYDTSERLREYYLRNLVSLPLGNAVVAATITAYASRTVKKNKLLLFSSFAIVILQAITSGGRYILMNSFFMILCAFAVYKNEYKVKTKQKILILISFIVLGWLIVYLTDNRASYIMRDMNILEKLYTTIYTYFSGSVTYLGEVIKRNPEIVGSTYGINLYAGFIRPIIIALVYLRFISYPEIFNVIGKYACAQLQIGPMSYYNAMPTVFGYFFIDGGYILTFIEAFIFGYICKRLFTESKKGKLMITVMYVLIFSQICNSSTRWFLYTPDFALAFIYIRIFFRKERKYVA